jgi:MFS family permease
MLCVTQVNAIWQFYLLRGIIVSVGFTLMGGLVTTVAISNWFVKKRGRAIAISRAGVNLSNIIFVPITVSVLAASNWQTMFVVFAVVTWAVVLLPSTIFMRRRPEDMGLYPDGISLVDSEVRKDKAEDNKINQVLTQEEHVWKRKEVLRTKSFWLLAFSFGISSIAFQGINISLAPYIQDLNYSDATLTAILTFRAIIMAVSVLFMGFVAEYAHLVPVRIAPSIIQGIGACLFLFAEDQILLWLAVTVYGLGFSGVTVIQEVVWANYYGRLSLGLVRSLAFLVAFGFGAAGPVAMNLVFDIVGSYKPAFIVVSILFGITALLMGIAKPPDIKISISKQD